MGDIHVPGDGRCRPNELAAAQHGLVTRAQLRLPSSTIDSWVRRGRLLVLYPGVYALEYLPATAEARWLAAVLACGPGAVLSHLSAAVLWGIWLAEGMLIDVTAARGRRGPRGVTLHRPRNPPAWTVHRGIPVTTPAQTVADLARTFSPVNLERLVGEAQLLASFDAQALPPRLLHLTDDPASGVPRNVLERRFKGLCRAAKLPVPATNVEWGRWEIDFLFRDHGVAVETDGRATHERRAQFQRDREKDRDLQLGGLLALRFTHSEVMRRAEVVTTTLLRACR